MSEYANTGLPSKLSAELAELIDGHPQRVTSYFHLLLQIVADRDIGASIIQKDIPLMVEASKLHDIGKRFIPKSLLEYPGRLTDHDYDIVKMHTVLGAQFLRNIENIGHRNAPNRFFEFAAMFALSHHEKWDGSGYSNGLKALDIPLVVRILSIADVYDALVSSRSYKGAISHAKTIELIGQDRNKAFDPELTGIFLETHKAFEKLSSEHCLT